MVAFVRNGASLAIALAATATLFCYLAEIFPLGNLADG